MLETVRRRPNIILIMVDDMGYGGLSCYDNKYYKTPNIDKLAADGMLLTDFHSNGSVCSPTRAALMTGRYQYRLGCQQVINADPEHHNHVRGMPDKEWTIGEALKTGGYTTAIFGKWHIGYKKEFNPVLHGFDQFNGFVSGNIDAHSHYDRMETFDWWQNEELKDEPGYHTDLLTDHTIDFIRRHKDKPFFIYVPHGAPHSPHQARGSKILRGPQKGTLPPWAEQGVTYSDDPNDDNWLMKQFVLPVDDGVGRIRKEVENLGLAKKTVIWFISDNGGTKRNGTTSPQTRSGKGSFYEGGHRVPGIIWAPGYIKPGVCNELIIGMDIMPTTLTMAGVATPDGHHFDGVDVTQTLLKSTKLPERTLIWGRESLRAVRKGPWKVVDKELYNLDDDPQETRDLASEKPKLFSALLQEGSAMYQEAISESPWEEIVAARPQVIRKRK
ncbi:hypothetical protein BVX97_03985 [bacterium E08(2017)]|nr:hypothetical protein BVX97_03985 [bacterium E08(2017)]